MALWLESLLQDLRIAVRLWGKYPVMAMAAILTITLGAGLSISAFQLVWNVVLQGLPYGRPGELVQIWIDEGGEERRNPQNLIVDRWRDASQTLSHIASYRQWRVTVTGNAGPELVTSAMVSSEFFDSLETPLLAGRAFTKQENSTGADRVVILRERFAKQRFVNRASALDQELNIDGVLCRVVGIVPDSFEAGPLVQVARGIAISGRGAVIESAVHARTMHWAGLKLE